jgi:arabinofuranosyltransferase
MKFINYFIFTSFIILTFPYWKFIQDDVYIFMQFARNFIEHGEITFHLGEPVHALTSPIWFLFTLFFMKISYLISENYFFCLFSIKFLSGVFSLAALYQFKNLIYNLVEDNELRFLGISFLLFDLWIWRWSFSGMETSLSVFTILFLTNNYFFSSKKLESIVSMVFLGFLIRPEIIFFSFIIMIDYIYNTYFIQKKLKLYYNWQIVIPIVLFFIWSLFSLFNFGTLLPITGQGKQNVLTSAQSIFHSIKILIASQALNLAILNFLIICFIGIKKIRMIILNDKYIVLFLSWVLFLPLFYFSKGYWPISRYLLLIIPFIILINTRIFGLLKSNYKFFNDRFKYILISTITISICFNFFISFSRILPSSNNSKIAAKKVMADFINENLPLDAKIVTSEIGVLGYYTQRYLIDLGGLITPSKDITKLRKSLGNTQFAHINKYKYTLKNLSPREYNTLIDGMYMFKAGFKYKLLNAEKMDSQVASVKPAPLYYCLFEIMYD